MAIETDIVAIVAAMAHHDIGVFLWDYNVVLGIKAQRRRLVALMAGIAVKVRKIGFGANHLGIGNANSGIAGEHWIDQRDGRQGLLMAPEVQGKAGGQRQEQPGQNKQNRVRLHFAEEPELGVRSQKY